MNGGMQLSLIVRGQHPPGDIAAHLKDDLDLVRRADELGFDGIVQGSHYSAHPFEYLQQVPFLAYAAAIAPRLRLICGLVLLPLHKPLDLAERSRVGISRRLRDRLASPTFWAPAIGRHHHPQKHAPRRGRPGRRRL